MAFEIGLAVVEALRPLMARIGACDGDLARQIRRAASSVPLNVAEGRRRSGKDRAYHYRVAAGSAAEVRAALRVVAAWGYLEAHELAAPLALCDRELRLLYGLAK